MQEAKRVLIVEAEEGLRKGLTKFYENKGYDVIAIDGAFLALKLLAMNTFVLVVTDLNAATIKDFYNQVKALSDASLICSTEVDMIGTPISSAGLIDQRQQLSIIN